MGPTSHEKICCLQFNGVKINIVDASGHADFWREPERTPEMADGAICRRRAGGARCRRRSSCSRKRWTSV